MKKLTAIALCTVLMLACTAVFAESQEQQTGVYTIYNVTGENVAWIELLDNVTGDSTKVDFPDGLANGASVQMTKSIPASEDGNHRLTLSFETESGYAGTFATLSIEEAPISLLAQDALSGATQISFTKPEATEKETIGKVSLNGAFTLQGKLPEGFKVQDLTPEELKDSAHFSMIHSDDTTKPFMYLSIGLNELLTEVDRLNDLDEAALAHCIGAHHLTLLGDDLSVALGNNPIEDRHTKERHRGDFPRINEKKDQGNYQYQHIDNRIPDKCPDD